MNLIFDNCFVKKIKVLIFSFSLIIFLNILAFFWWFWFIFSFFCFFLLVVYYSKGLRNISNIHLVALGLMMLHAFPSIFLILQGEINLEDQGRLILFSSIVVGLVGYFFGSFFLKKSFNFPKSINLNLSKRLNYLFWLVYKYRYIVAAIAITLVYFLGSTPMSMSYSESIQYRMETPGAVQYLNALIPSIFSVLMITMLVIVGDMKRIGRLSFLSILLIGIVFLEIIGGHRMWIISLLACLIINFQSRLNNKYILIIAVTFIFLSFVISGGVRFARSGGSFTKNLNNFYDYFLNVGEMDFNSLVWGWSDFIVPFSTFIDVIKNVPEEIGFKFLLPFEDFSLFIPTIIYPNRPLPIAEWYVKNFKPEVYARGGGRTFFTIGTGYVFAGHIGVFLYLFLFGVLFELIRKFLKGVGSPVNIFLYSYFFSNLFSFARGGEFFVFIKKIIIDFLIPLLLLSLFVIFLDFFRIKKKK
jgi:hypothetical protein